MCVAHVKSFPCLYTSLPKNYFQVDIYFSFYSKSKIRLAIEQHYSARCFSLSSLGAQLELNFRPKIIGFITFKSTASSDILSCYTGVVASSENNNESYVVFNETRRTQCPYYTDQCVRQDQKITHNNNNTLSTSE